MDTRAEAQNFSKHLRRAIAGCWGFMMRPSESLRSSRLPAELKSAAPIMPSGAEEPDCEKHDDGDIGFAQGFRDYSRHMQQRSD